MESIKYGDRTADRLREILGDGSVFENEPMSRHTTFRIGGPADFFVTPRTPSEISRTLDYCRLEGIPCAVIGNGSNLLVSDEGVRGVVVRLGKEFSRIIAEGETVRAEAGALLSQVAGAAAEAELTGMEFAGGIPGTLGGACIMNAGAYGGEMKQILFEVNALLPDGTQKIFRQEEMGLGYRTSTFMKENLIVLEAVLHLKKGESSRIRAISEELKRKRQEKQPLDLPSAGSTFKRPEGYFAGKLIMDAGLRGYRVGGAQVSEKHCGFVVNTGGATAADVRQLISEVRNIVRDRFGVTLEPEVRFL